MESNSSDVKLADLVAGFRANLTALRDPQTSEAVVRQEYIDPFWRELGWDVANKDHRSYAEKDVLIEASVGTIEGERPRNRRPDYLFRIILSAVRPLHLELLISLSRSVMTLALLPGFYQSLFIPLSLLLQLHSRRELWILIIPKP